MRHLAGVEPSSAHGRSAREELTHFCTNCATLHEGASQRRRVCSHCGLGVVLTCASATLSAPGAVFLVVTADLYVSAASEQAEDMLGSPDGTYGRPLTSLLTSPAGVGELTHAVVRAARGSYAPTTIPVKAAASKLDVTADARVGGCGNPPAALVVIEHAL